MTLNDKPPFIIAEIGSNWKTLDDCLYSVRMAKHAGADAAKFQLFTYEMLYGTKTQRQLSGYCPILDPNWLTQIAMECKAHSIEFMCSGFSPHAIDLIDKHVNIHKVASSEMNHVRMLEKLNELGKPVILSTAAAHLEDIKRSLAILKDVPTIPMYCVGSYPAKVIDLRIIQALRAELHKDIGYSDHSTDVLNIPKDAVRLGAIVIEKHMTAIDKTTPDSGHSINPDEFKLMVQSLRNQLPAPMIGPIIDERAMQVRHRRRLIAIKEIRAGDKFVENVNFGIFRSMSDDTKALSPFNIDTVNNATASRNIREGEGIGPQDILSLIR